jgi:hypothetical protein
MTEDAGMTLRATGRPIQLGDRLHARLTRVPSGALQSSHNHHLGGPPIQLAAPQGVGGPPVPQVIAALLLPLDGAAIQLGAHGSSQTGFSARSPQTPIHCDGKASYPAAI